jgi:CHAT domain-containing protein
VEELRQRNPDFETLVTTDPHELLDLQSHLSPDETVVQLYPGEDALYFQVVRSNGLELHEVRVSRKRLFELISRVRELVGRPGTDPKSSLEELSHVLVEPIEAELPAGKGRLWLLPTSELWYVPWDALVRTSGRSLLETLDVACLTPQDLPGLARSLQRTVGKALVLGAPDGQDLPGSWAEAKEVAAQLGGQLLLGAEATPANLRRLGQGAGLLHFATHSHANPALPADSSVMLYGAPLAVPEIYGLQLAPGALVVLSSCESGLGREHPGREVTSLASAFHAAGASSVISTLWPVDDAAQSRLFPEFYRDLRHGDGRGAALAEAKRTLRAQPSTSHPFYWSGIYLLGDPR